MTANTAKRLLEKDISNMPLEKLQHHRVSLLDAWRESTGEYYGIPQAVRDGFMVAISDRADSYTPKDKWLTYNLKCVYEEACRQEKKLLRKMKGDCL